MRAYLMVLGIAILAAGLVAGCGGTTTPSTPNKAPDAAQAETAPITPIAEAPSTPPAPDAPAAEGEAPATPDAAAQVPGQPAVEEPPAEPIPDVVAKVGDKTIAGKDLERQLKHATRMVRTRGMGGEVPAAQKREILNQMINDEILFQVAEKAGTTFTKEEAMAEIEKAKQGMPSPEMFTQYLKTMQMDEDTLIEMVRQQKLREKFVKEHTKDSPVTEEELQAEYNKLKEQGNLERKQETANVSHILVKVEGTDEAAWAEGKKKIDAARERILAGEDFAKVAQEMTDDPGSKQRGGAYPDTPRGMMVPEFDEKMWTIPIGEVSEPFRTQFGWHILKVTARHEKGTMQLDEIRDQMTRMIERRKEQEFVQKTLDEAKPKIPVEILYTPAETAPATPPGPEGVAPQAPAAPATPEAPAAPEKPAAPETPPAPEAPAAPATPPAPAAPSS
ncbi:MAG: peptidylprolyl isomerase [Candidatus Hydrogenedentes bacterium]|nr:peptidylprolyl isomerase [Candidatus Hydrogenedentota bacterium]